MKNFFRKAGSKTAVDSPTKNNGSDPDFQNGLDKKLVHSLNQNKLPRPKQIKHLGKVLDHKEWLIFRIAAAVIIVCLIFLGLRFYLNNFLPTPIVGGEHTEALVGAPQYINPLLSQTNDVDSDISKLAFSSLLKYDKNLNLVPDLASGYEISEDLKTYTFTLKENILWHDGTPFTADDVIFSVESILDPDFKSPLLPSLRGVEINKLDEKTIAFTLPEPFPPFLEALTFGIIPAHIWREIPPINANLTEYNLKPIGTGAWKFKKLNKDSLGNIKSYVLEANQDYYDKVPYLEKLTFKFYPDFETAVEALKSKTVGGISFLPKRLKDNLTSVQNVNFHSFSLPQYTAIFFNQKQNENLKSKNVRKALSLAIDKPKILSEALRLEGEIIEGPIIPGFIGYDPTNEKMNFDSSQANQLLEDAGWEKVTLDEYKNILEEKYNDLMAEAEEAATENQEENQPEEAILSVEEYISQNTNEEQNFYRQDEDGELLEITLTTVDQPENITAAQLIQGFWRDIGVKTNLQIVESARMSREIIKPRNYQALLYGIIAGADPDPFPFWHSSQVQDPGLNLANFANREIDKLLEAARKTTDMEKKIQYYSEFQNTIIAEIPAIFLYNPTYTYVLDKDIKGLDISRIVIPSDRFNNIGEWYIKTKRKYKKN